MKHILIRVLLICTLAAIQSLEWPVEEFYPVSFFGQRSKGIIERGITFEKAEIIRAAGNGKILVTLVKNANMSGFPSTLGNCIILSHTDGLITIYGNLESLDRVSEQVQIESQSLLGKTGTSSWGKPNYFIFQVVDTVKKNVLNPLLLMPSIKDQKSPSIRNVVMTSASSQMYVLNDIKSVKQGTYRLYADITDVVEKLPIELSPFRISVLVNGREFLTLPFELLTQNNGKLFLASSDYCWETLYADDKRTYLGELALARGKAEINIIARDASGNERSVQFDIRIE